MHNNRKARERSKPCAHVRHGSSGLCTVRYVFRGQSSRLGFRHGSVSCVPGQSLLVELQRRSGSLWKGCLVCESLTSHTAGKHCTVSCLLNSANLTYMSGALFHMDGTTWAYEAIARTKLCVFSLLALFRPRTFWPNCPSTPALPVPAVLSFEPLPLYPHRP